MSSLPPPAIAPDPGGQQTTPAPLRVSLIIPTFNGASLLPPCLDSIAAQSRQPDETFVVDDASTDVTPALLAQRYPWVRPLILPKNLGFVGAVNAGIAAASGDVIVLLNNDTEADHHWLRELVAPLEQDPSVAYCASKMLLFDHRDRLQSAGDGYSTGGVPVNRGAWARDDGRYDEAEDVFGASGGAGAYRRALLEETGTFDPWLVSYLEDVDLNWRAQLRGFRCRYVPTARVYHRVSASGGGVRPSYYCGRNFLLVLASDVPGPLLRRHWRAILREQGGIVLEALWHMREPAARARLRGILAGLHDLPAALRRRKRFQATRTVPVERLDALLTRR